MTTSAPARATGHIDAAQRGAHPWLALALLCLAQFMLILDVTVVNVALPDIGVGLHLSRPTLTWVLTAYTLVFGGLMLLGGRLADLFGARRVLLVGLAIFTGASLLSGLSVLPADAGMLIGGRIGQGAGAALLSPSALSLVTATFTGSKRAKALGVWAAVGAAGSAVGVALGGVLTSVAGWPWVFFINVPTGLLVLATLPALIRPTASRPRRRGVRVDVPGALTVTAATGAAIYGLISAGSHGWVSASTLVPIGAAAVLYAAFVLIESTVKAPLMDVRMLTRKPVAASTFLMLVATGLLVGAYFLGSFYLQRVRGYSALETGLLFLPVAAASVLGAQSAGHAAARLDGRALAAGALGLGAAGAAVAAIWPGAVTLIIGMSVSAIGLGAALVTAFTTALARVGPDVSGVASGIVNTFHELGGAIGVAVVSSIAAPSLAAAQLGATGFTRAFTFSAAAALAAAVVAAFVVPAGRPPAGATPHAH
jgi:EmrB/QacA subfamily drug resistance transporter